MHQASGRCRSNPVWRSLSGGSMPYWTRRKPIPGHFVRTGSSSPGAEPGRFRPGLVGIAAVALPGTGRVPPVPVRSRGPVQRPAVAASGDTGGPYRLRAGLLLCGWPRRAIPPDAALGIGPGQRRDGIQRGWRRLRAARPFGLAAESCPALTGGRHLAPARAAESRGGAWAAGRELPEDAGATGPQQVRDVAGPTTAGVWAAALAWDAAQALRFDDGWRAVKAGVVFWAKPRRDGSGMAGGKATAQSHVAGVEPMEPAGERLYREAVRRGIDPAEALAVCLGDGAPAHRSRFRLYCPKRVAALDCYHAVAHLWAAARERWAEDRARMAAWVKARQGEWWEGDAAALTAWAAGEATSESRCFETSRRRMRNAESRARGYPMGSGRVERAGKGGIGARLKPAGTRWSKTDRRASSAELADPVDQRPLGRRLAPHPSSSHTCLNLGVHPLLPSPPPAGCAPRGGSANPTTGTR